MMIAGSGGDSYASSSIIKRIDEIRKERKAASSAKESEDGFMSKAKEWLSYPANFFSMFAKWIAELIYLILDYIGFGFRVMFKFFIIFTQQFYLCMLALIGPIAFTLSIFPGYSSTLTNWISKYVSVLFWAPIIALADVFIGKILALTNDWFFNILSNPTNAGITHHVIATLAGLSLLLSLYSYFIYKKVPTIASWIIQGGDTGNASSLANVLGTIAGAVGAIVGASYISKAGAAGARGAQGAQGTAGGGTAASSATTKAGVAQAAGSVANSQN
jgi:hypothetical protein